MSSSTRLSDTEMLTRSLELHRLSLTVAGKTDCSFCSSSVESVFTVFMLSFCGRAKETCTGLVTRTE